MESFLRSPVVPLQWGRGTFGATILSRYFIKHTFSFTWFKCDLQIIWIHWAYCWCLNPRSPSNSVSTAFPLLSQLSIFRYFCSFSPFQTIKILHSVGFENTVLMLLKFLSVPTSQCSSPVSTEPQQRHQAPWKLIGAFSFIWSYFEKETKREGRKPENRVFKVWKKIAWGKEIWRHPSPCTPSILTACNATIVVNQAPIMGSF